MAATAANPSHPRHNPNLIMAQHHLQQQPPDLSSNASSPVQPFAEGIDPDLRYMPPPTSSVERPTAYNKQSVAPITAVAAAAAAAHAMVTSATADAPLPPPSAPPDPKPAMEIAPPAAPLDNDHDFNSRIDPGLPGVSSDLTPSRSFTFPSAMPGDQQQHQQNHHHNDHHGPRNYSLPNPTSPNPAGSARDSFDDDLHTEEDTGDFDLPPGESPKSGGPFGKKHKCHHCKTEFTRHHNLKSHLLTHSQEKPYECQQCHSRFRRLHDLKRHTKLHTGERPHECPTCSRRFARGDALARHIKGPGGCAGRRSSMIDDPQAFHHQLASAAAAAAAAGDGNAMDYTTSETDPMDENGAPQPQDASAGSARPEVFRPSTYPSILSGGAHVYPALDPTTRSRDPTSSHPGPLGPIQQFNQTPTTLFHQAVTDSPKPITPLGGSTPAASTPSLGDPGLPRNSNPRSSGLVMPTAEPPSITSPPRHHSHSHSTSSVHAAAAATAAATGNVSVASTLVAPPISPRALDIAATAAAAASSTGDLRTTVNRLETTLEQVTRQRSEDARTIANQKRELDLVRQELAQLRQSQNSGFGSASGDHFLSTSSGPSHG